ncbi:MAG: nuclear transport factor 2 family protein [Proteobacteria bacterium]|nr:nuclear transport factor 2 family protein [Pseudomonadota bacterium]
MKSTLQVLAVVAGLGAGVALFASAQTPPHGAATSAIHEPADPETVIATADADIAEVVRLEMATLEWSRLNQADQMAAHHAEDWIGIPNGPPMTRAEMLQAVGTETLRSYKISNVMTRRIARDVVLVTYRMQQDGSTGAGVKWVPLVQASAVWARREGKWLAVFYQETVL